MILYEGLIFCGEKSTSPWDHATWNPEHPPCKIEKIQSHPLWISNDFSYIQEHTPAQRIQRFKEKIVSSNLPSS